MPTPPKPNITGRKINKLEHITRLLQKLNEDCYTSEELETGGYPINLTMNSDGSGILYDYRMGCCIYRFKDQDQLEQFLSASRIRQYCLGRQEQSEFSSNRK